MAYVSSSGTLQSQRPWSLSMISDYFYGTLNFVSLFFRSLFNFGETGGTRRGQFGSGSQNAPRTPGRRMGSLGRVSGVAAPPCVPGGG